VRALLAALVTLSVGCASARPGHRAAVTPEELLAGASLGSLEGAAPVDDKQVLAVSAEMRAFLDRHVARGAGPVSRLRQLSRAILDEDTFGLKYDEITRTAAETFHVRRGNCLSFSNMFVVLARAVDLKASFQEVDTPPDWSFRDAAFILNRHVNVVVDLGRMAGPQTRIGSLVGRRPEATAHVVDFNMDDFRTTYDRRRISDARGLAHYHNNVGVERMQAGDTASAFLYFRRALQRDASFAPAWTNMGTLYRRQGARAHAEAAYLQALAVDKGDLVAMSNLASLYEGSGNHEQAVAYRRRVAAHRNSNPYYRFHLAREAVREGDWDTAIGHLKYAIGRKRNEDQFYFFLGVSYFGKGDEAAARRWLSRAEEIAATDALKRRYASKIEILLAGSR
jgi:tetratricopeptide (TPR) repeat protein